MAVRSAILATACLLVSFDALSLQSTRTRAADLVDVEVENMKASAELHDVRSVVLDSGYGPVLGVMPVESLSVRVGA